MWILEPTAPAMQDGKSYRILGDHKYVVGRQNCDIVVSDPSVSRKQAVLTMAHYETNVAKSFITPTLTLEDVSKFGTFVNGKAVKTAVGNTTTLKDNDQIKFGGTPESIYRVRYCSFLATTSCLEKSPKKALQRVMCLLGGHLVRDWRPSCDLLIMSKINVTLKVICTINNQKHIVTPKYLEDLYEHHMGRRDEPDPLQYLPEVVDQEVPSGVSFHPDIRRQTLLAGLKFYFLSPLQFNKTNLAVSTAGGQPILLEDGSEEEADAMTQKDTVVVLVTKDVMDSLDPASAKFVRTVVAALRKENLRMITDPEIGTAILTCNMTDYCNPRAPLAPNLQAAMASQMFSQMTDLMGSQQSIGATAQTAQDRKPPLSASAPDNKRPSRVDISESQLIKKEKISQEKLCPKGHEGRVAKESMAPPMRSPLQQPIFRPGETIVRPPTTKPASSQELVQNAKVGKHILEPKDANTTGSTAENSLSNAASLQSSSRLSGDLFSDSLSKDSFTENKTTPHKLVVSKQQYVEEDEDDMRPNIFARQKNKRNNGFHSGCRSVSDEDDDLAPGRAKKGTVKQKRTNSLFDDDDDDDYNDNPSRKSVNSAKIPLKRKGQFSSDDEEYDTGTLQSSAKNHAKSKRTSKPSLHAETASRLINSSEDSHNNHSHVRAKTKEGLSPNLQSTSKLTTCANGEKPSDTSADNSWSSGRKLNNDHFGPNDEVNLSPPRATVTEGWLSTSPKKRISENSHDDVEEGDHDVKPDRELLRDGGGKVLRNLCEVEVTNLVVRQQGTRLQEARQSSSKSSDELPNYKKFQKTENAGAGNLPTIIGGRDLEEHVGNAHKGLEDLFLNGLMRENERLEDEDRANNLFEWDKKTKNVNKRKR